MSSIFILAKLVEESSCEIKVKEYKTNKNFTLNRTPSDVEFQIENLYLFKLNECRTDNGKHVFTEVSTLEELSKQKNLPTIDDVVLYIRMLASIERLRSRSESLSSPRWDAGNQTKASQYLKELKEKGIDVAESEAQFNKLLSQKNQIKIKERKHHIEESLNHLEELTAKHRWSNKVADECLKGLKALKNKKVDVTPLELRFGSLKEKIMSDEVFLSNQRAKISEKIDNKILEIEDGILYGTHKKAARKYIDNIWKDVEKFNLDNHYAPKIEELDIKIELLKQGKLNNPFSDEEKKVIMRASQIVDFSMIKDVILEKRGILPKADHFVKEMIRKNIMKYKKELLELKLKYPKNHKYFCVELVKRAPEIVLLLDEPTEESCIIALENNIELFKFLENKTVNTCLYALSKDGNLLEYIEEHTPEMCMTALEQNPDSIVYFKI